MKADMEVLTQVTDKTTETTKPKKTRAKAVKAVVNEEPPVDPEPQAPETPLYMPVNFLVMDRIIEEVASGKSIKEAIAFDARLSSAFADHPFIVVRESRNDYYYALRSDLPLMASTSPSSIGITPVSYALPK